MTVVSSQQSFEIALSDYHLLGGNIVLYAYKNKILLKDYSYDPITEPDPLIWSLIIGSLQYPFNPKTTSLKSG
jgi:hypothetical protein